MPKEEMNVMALYILMFCGCFFVHLFCCCLYCGVSVCVFQRSTSDIFLDHFLIVLDLSLSLKSLSIPGQGTTTKKRA